MKLVNDEDHPLLNKAIQAQLAPGSVFKIIMATAGLQEGIAQDMKVNCTGGASFYGRYFKCWVVAEHRTHGIVDISKAIYQSCDVFFYTLAEKLGIERIAKYAMAFGLGQKTGIDLPQEVSGVMPSEEWKIRNFKQKWYAGETISVGIGQGAVAATPIQLARAIGAIASGGLLVRPHVTNPRDLPPAWCRRRTVPDEVRVPIDPNNWEIITDAMAGVRESGRDGSAVAPAGHRLCRENRQRADHQQRAESEAWSRRQSQLQRQRMVCRSRAATQSGNCGVRPVGRRRARLPGGPHRGPGDQGLRGEAAPLAQQDGQWNGQVDVGAVWHGDDDDDAIHGGHFVLDLPRSACRWHGRARIAVVRRGCECAERAWRDVER